MYPASCWINWLYNEAQFFIVLDKQKNPYNMMLHVDKKKKFDHLARALELNSENKTLAKLSNISV